MLVEQRQRLSGLALAVFAGLIIVFLVSCGPKDEVPTAGWVMAEGREMKHWQLVVEMTKEYDPCPVPSADWWGRIFVRDTLEEVTKECGYNWPSSMVAGCELGPHGVKVWYFENVEDSALAHEIYHSAQDYCGKLFDRPYPIVDAEAGVVAGKVAARIKALRASGALAALDRSGALKASTYGEALAAVIRSGEVNTLRKDPVFMKEFNGFIKRNQEDQRAL